MEPASHTTEFVGLNDNVICSARTPCEGFSIEGEYTVATDVDGKSDLSFTTTLTVPEGQEYLYETAYALMMSFDTSTDDLEETEVHYVFKAGLHRKVVSITLPMNLDYAISNPDEVWNDREEYMQN